MKIRILVAIFVFVTAAIAQNSDNSAVIRRMETITKSYTTGNSFMGTVLVVDGDRTLLNQGFGMASLEWNIPNDQETKFKICSLTKQFTAALVLLLEQDGKLHIDDPLNKYLSDAPAGWGKITLRELLNHTSGIPDLISDKEFASWSMVPHTPVEQLAFFRDKSLDFEPGTKFAYSNSNYVVLGIVIEKVSGQQYETFLRERILEPLGMKDTGLDTDDLVLPRRAEGYGQGRNGLVAARSMSMSVPWAAGALYSTTGDLLRWERGLFGGKILNDAELKAMTAAGKGNYGLGVEVRDVDGLKVIEHGGGIQGFSTELIYVPERNLAVVVLSNVYSSVPGTLGEQLLDVALGKPVILASERKPVPIAKEELKKFIGTYDLSPAFAITITVGGDSLMAQGTGQGHAIPMMYQGNAGGHARFYVPHFDAEVEFVPDATGEVASLVLHQGGGSIPGKKRAALPSVPK